MSSCKITLLEKLDFMTQFHLMMMLQRSSDMSEKYQEDKRMIPKYYVVCIDVSSKRLKTAASVSTNSRQSIMDMYGTFGSK